MTIYLKNKEADAVLREFGDVISFASNYVLYMQQKNMCKVYAGKDEYFTDVVETDENSINE